MKHLLFATSLILGSLVSAAEPQTLFFERETAKDSTRIALTMDGGTLNGTKTWRPKQEAHGARGTLQGSMKGAVISATWDYTIEGNEQSEQQIYKLDGDRLLIGTGELVERNNDAKLTFKDPSAVKFTTVLQRVEAREPKAGTPERKAIMDAMREPVSGQIGKPVIFTGGVRASGSWARFQGNVATTDGKKPTKRDAAELLELDFFALLTRDADGAWKVAHWGFAGDTGASEAAREKFPKAPWVLFE
ncbi:MAG: hypothetical protein NTV08_00765 [Verrucomicrobia bacterium]|nr:hypothetical protein [Verrucomicrobiota bacterium]